jgi:alkylglycerol monooxygenase
MMDYILLAVPIFLIMILLEILVTRQRGWSFYHFNDAIIDLSCGIGQQTTGFFIKAGIFAFYTIAYERYALWHWSAKSPWCWIVAFLVVDFAYYWWHRLSHEVNFLWAIHAVHHHSEDYNLAVGLRQAWFSSISNIPFQLPLVLLLGIPPIVLITTFSLNVLYQFWIHTRAIGKLGWVEAIFNTPSHHRVHHGRNEKYLDKNYSGVFICWDKWFGSFQVEEEEPLYGTVKVYGSWNPIWANFHYWVELLQLSRQANNWSDRLKVWLKYPGWLPANVSRTSPPPDPTPVRYQTPMLTGLNCYIFSHFLVISLLAALIGISPPTTEQYIAGAFVLITTFIWGGLFEAKPWALRLEYWRLTFIGVLAIKLGYTGIINNLTAGLVLSSAIIWAVWLSSYRLKFQALSARQPQDKIKSVEVAATIS